jgi:type I restriction enzyme S subunit
MKTNDDWPRVPVKEVCELVVDCINNTAPTVEGPTPYQMIRTPNVGNGRIDLSDARYVEKEVYEEWIRRGEPQPGDVILTREAPLGDVGLLRTDENVFLGQRLMMYRADPEKMDNRFLLYILQSRELQGQMKAKASGATVEHLRVPDAETLEIPLPPLPVQRRIAGILGAYDDLIENNRRRIELLEEMATTIFREWFVHYRFPGHEDVEMRETEIGTLPKEWTVKPIGELATSPRSRVDPDEMDPDTPYFGLGDMPKESITLSEWGRAENAGSKKYSFDRGDILFGKIRPYFHKVGPAPVGGICSTDAIVIVPNSDELYGLVLGHVSSEEFVDLADQTSSGTKMPRAKWKILKEEYKVAIPPPSLLSQFNDTIQSFVDQLHNLIHRNHTLRETRDLLLPRLMAGEIDVETETTRKIAE